MDAIQSTDASVVRDQVTIERQRAEARRRAEEEARQREAAERARIAAEEEARRRAAQQRSSLVSKLQSSGYTEAEIEAALASVGVDKAAAKKHIAQARKEAKARKRAEAGLKMNKNRVYEFALHLFVLTRTLISPPKRAARAHWID